MPPSYRVGIVGATGAVGAELIQLLADRRFPISELKLYASPRSAGRTADFLGKSLPIEPLSASELKECEFVFLSAGSGVSKDVIPEIRRNCICIDNSSAFRMASDVPLVVPEINGREAIGQNVIANPNCTAIILLMAIAPLRQLGEFKRVIVSTYQSASGAGAQGMDELVEQTRDVLNGSTTSPNIFPHPYAFNLFSHNTPIGEDGSNEEESKVVAEVRKILSEPELGINVTCVRVPVLRAHTESVTLEFDSPAPDLETVRKLLAGSPGVKVVDNRDSNHFPMPIEASGQNDVLVGRLRTDPSNPNAIRMLICGDQLLKGAALNAVQIAELLV